MIETYIKEIFIDSTGNVYSTKSGNIKQLKTRKDKDGYLRFNVVHNNKHQTILVYRLIANTISPETESNLVVDHIDRNRTNNSFDNLRKVSYCENSRNSSFIKTTKEMVCSMIKLREEGKSYSTIAKIIGCSNSSAEHWCNKDFTNENSWRGLIESGKSSFRDEPHYERQV